MRLVNEPHLLPVEDMLRRTVGREADGLRARVLSPTDRVLHLLLHDLVQDRGIHDGRLNLRHLHEIAVLLASGAPLRWDEIMARLARHRLGHLAEVALLAVRFFFAMPIPAGIRPSARARLHLWRALLQLRHPWLARCGEVFGNAHYCLAWYRHATGYKRLPRLRRSLDYLRAHRIRTAGRVLHILFAHRT
jgi:hypothetical protein